MINPAHLSRGKNRHKKREIESNTEEIFFFSLKIFQSRQKKIFHAAFEVTDSICLEDGGGSTRTSRTGLFGLFFNEHFKVLEDDGNSQ